MEVIKDISLMHLRLKDLKNRGKTIGFVPTMGFFHEGHLSLIKKAKEKADVVVVSIFVNPTQFGPMEDFQEYPRDLDKDIKTAENLGVDFLFNPAVEHIYPEGFSTYVIEEKLSNVLCGKSRPNHFKGVVTIVTKLFNIVLPDYAFFGQKDIQQAIIIKKICRDLNISLNIIILPTVREPDGLAMSSRNKYLSSSERKDAVLLYNCIREARRIFSQGETDSQVIKSRIKDKITKNKNICIDYIEIVDSKNLEKVYKVSSSCMLVMAIWINKVRLIDNTIF